jgi:hypothetical protein
MKEFFASIIVAIIVAAGAMYALDAKWQQQVDQAYNSPTSVRLPDHDTTHNLVGKDWYSAKEH